MNVNDLLRQPSAWLSGQGPCCDVVISSRVRLARNLAGFPFLSRATEGQRREIQRLIWGAIGESKLDADTFYVDIDQADELDRELLVERHLISRQHARGEGSRGVALSGAETIAVMINEEDHLRIQALRSGLQLDEVWADVARIDKALEDHLEYAYHPRFGYLTACPTNVGTGLRISVMLHLPALKMTNEIERALRAARDMRLAVRGLFGEGTEAIGDFYQVSNQTTLGKSEAEIVEDFKSQVIPSIVEYESHVRESLVRDKAAVLDDKIFRAYGVLGHARSISSQETLGLLSHVRMGVSLGRLKGVDLKTVNDLFLLVQPAHLQKLRGAVLDEDERGVVRADYIRRRLTNGQGQS
jgi:protein arginine kinase